MILFLEFCSRLNFLASLSDKEKGVLQDATELGEEDSDSRSSTIASLTEDEGYKVGVSDSLFFMVPS